MADPAVPARAPAARPPAAPADPPSRALHMASPADGPWAGDPLASLVRLAVDDDDSGGLVAAAAAELGGPLGLVALTGEALAHAPDDAGGRRALALAGAVARRAGTSLPAGWRVLAVAPRHARRALLAVGTDDADEDAAPLLDVIVALLGEQLLRAGLRRDQTAALLRRLLSEPGMGAERARGEAAAIGLTLPDTSWAAVVAWRAGAPDPAPLDAIDREARRLAPGSLTATVGGRLVLLHPAGEPAADVAAWVERVVARARILAPCADARAVAGDEPVALGELGGHVTRLVRLCGCVMRSEPPRTVVRARRYALEGLLRDSVAPAQARVFVDDLLGALIAWDRDHRADLLRVLEAALDNPRHDLAAQRCFMHRNTFRHRLHKAHEVLGDDLADAEMRLAVHVALKLRRATAGAPRGGSAAGRRTAAAPRRGEPFASAPTPRSRPAGAR
jgi:hypothetical protein